MRRRLVLLCETVSVSRVRRPPGQKPLTTPPPPPTTTHTSCGAQALTDARASISAPLFAPPSAHSRAGRQSGRPDWLASRSRRRRRRRRQASRSGLARSFHRQQRRAWKSLAGRGRAAALCVVIEDGVEQLKGKRETGDSSRSSSGSQAGASALVCSVCSGNSLKRSRIAHYRFRRASINNTDSSVCA